MIKFEETKLPNVQVVKDAFDHAQNNAQEKAPEIEAQLKAQVESLTEILTQLDRAKEAGQIDESRYNLQKAQLEQQKNTLEKNMPQLVARQIDGEFKEKVLIPVLELNTFSENTSPEVLAAALLLDSAPDPIDFEGIVEKFGKAVSDPLRNVLHLDAHRGVKTQEANLEKASEGERRIFKAELVISLANLPRQALQLPQGMALKVNEENLFKPIKQLWGGDKKQDARLTDVFNKVMAALKSTAKIEVNDNVPVLVKNAAPATQPGGPGKKPPLPEGNGF